MSFVRKCLSRNWCISFRVSILWMQSCPYYFLIILLMSMISVHCPSLISGNSNLHHLSFFLVSLAKGLMILTFFYLLIFQLISCFSYLGISTLILIITLLLLWVEIAFLFLVSYCGRLGFYIKIFFFFLYVHWML